MLRAEEVVWTCWICQVIFPRGGSPGGGCAGLVPGTVPWWLWAVAGVAGHAGDMAAVCQSRMSSGVCQLPGVRSPCGRAPRYLMERWGRTPRYLMERWGCVRAVENCGAGGRALTLSTVAHQMGDNSAVSPGWWRGDTQPWGSWGWGGWRMGPTLMSWLFSPIALLTLSMADDCKYGSSLSVCLSAVCRSWPRQFLSRVAARALPTPSSSSQLGPSLWSPSSCCLLGGHLLTAPAGFRGGGVWKGPGQFHSAWMWGDARVSDVVGGDGDGAVPCNQRQPNPG